jgi:hypothetical protein
MVGRCVTPEGGWKPFCEIEWQGVTGWASSCCMTEQFSYRVTQNLNLRGGPDKRSWNVLSDYGPQDYIPKGSIFTWDSRSAPNCSVGYGSEIWCHLTYAHDGTRTEGWLSAHFLRDNYGLLLACRYATLDPECAR